MDNEIKKITSALEKLEGMKNYLIVEIVDDYGEKGAYSLYLKKKNKRKLSEKEFEKLAEEINKKKLKVNKKVLIADSREDYIRLDLI